MPRLTRMLTLALSVAMIALFGAVGTASTATAAPGQSNTKTVAVTGKGPNGAKFDGLFAIADFATGSSPTGAVANGLLTGTLTQPGERGAGQSGGQSVSQNIAMPVAALQATCQVLNLTLGPLDLNLLGLQVHLDVVHLTINADPAGGLLGQLLCSLAGGIGGPVGTIIDLLNQILAALGG
jgi:hypothetical protein